ncbi:uncharacterized protein LOC132611680 [Lycium barbarum]|uniref:uncharacterized protein LOC132611680 n=1 Tax=Lycium barbarum TaxID=112863 RepID=UPI00293F5A10|nr:uncharacterized protein LOC132611680 [Lycium barbarum]
MGSPQPLFQTEESVYNYLLEIDPEGIGDTNDVQVMEKLSNEESLIAILDRQVYSDIWQYESTACFKDFHIVSLIISSRLNQCQIHSDLIKVPPNELNVMCSPWPFVAWGMDVIGPIDPTASNGHRFILVTVDYFTKWVEETSHKIVTKKVVVDFVRNNILCRFGKPESIITDNGANLNSHMMKDICEQFKITHQNSTSYRPQINGAVEAANKNIKRILRKMTDNYKGWREKLPYSLLGYCTTARTSTGATLYLLVYCTKAVIPAEVEIPFLRIIQEAELDNA